LSSACTIFVYYSTEDRLGWDGTMDWVLLGFAVITPLSLSVGFAFRRREEALRDIAIFKSIAFQIYLAHSSWNWGKQGNDERTTNKEYDWLGHADDVLKLLLEMSDEMFHFLTLPTMSRARHRVTKQGKHEANRTVRVAYALFHSFLTEKVTRVTKRTEDLKLLGLPANEASRIRQWERILGEAVEHLRVLKMYRTPQALRSFARIFSLLLPALYAPTFAQLARDVDSLGLGIAFAIIVSLALTALFNSIIILEDPFVGHITLDGIDVREELVVLHWEQLTRARKMCFPGAEEFQYEHELNKRKHSVETQTHEAIPEIVVSPLGKKDRITSYSNLRDASGSVHERILGCE